MAQLKAFLTLLRICMRMLVAYYGEAILPRPCSHFPLLFSQKIKRPKKQEISNRQQPKRQRQPNPQQPKRQRQPNRQSQPNRQRQPNEPNRQHKGTKGNYKQLKGTKKVTRLLSLF